MNILSLGILFFAVSVLVLAIVAVFPKVFRIVLPVLLALWGVFIGIYYYTNFLQEQQIERITGQLIQMESENVIRGYMDNEKKNATVSTYMLNGSDDTQYTIVFTSIAGFPKTSLYLRSECSVVSR